MSGGTKSVPFALHRRSYGAGDGHATADGTPCRSLERPSGRRASQRAAIRSPAASSQRSSSRTETSRRLPTRTTLRRGRISAKKNERETPSERAASSGLNASRVTPVERRGSAEEGASARSVRAGDSGSVRRRLVGTAPGSAASRIRSVRSGESSSESWRSLVSGSGEVRRAMTGMYRVCRSFGNPPWGVCIALHQTPAAARSRCRAWWSTRAPRSDR